MPYPKGDPEFEGRLRVFRDALARLGWVAGTNVQLDEQWTGGDIDQVRASAKSLVDANPDVLFGVGGRVIPVLGEMTRSIPIVAVGPGDPIGSGHSASLSRPSRNITGFTILEFSIVGKTLETLKQLTPGMARAGVIFNPSNPNSVHFQRLTEQYARQLSIEAVSYPIHGMRDVERAFEGLAEGKNVGVYFPPDLTIAALRREVIELCVLHKLPAIFTDPLFARDGGLASYGADSTALYSDAAGYVDRLLRGEKVANLPFQQPKKYQLILNLKTAATLGLEISPILLATADEVIE